MQLTLFFPQSVMDRYTLIFTTEFQKMTKHMPHGLPAWAYVVSFNQIGEEAMARRQATQNSNRQAWQTDFLNWKPSAAESKAFDSWLGADTEKADQAVDDMALSGHKLSIVFIPEMDCFNCALTPRDTNDVNYGKTLSVKSGDWKRGIYAMAFYCTVIAKSGLWDVSQDDGII